MFEHIDYISMPIERLNERGKELSWSINNIQHCAERKAQIQLEIGMISLEMWHRYQDGEFEFIHKK